MWRIGVPNGFYGLMSPFIRCDRSTDFRRWSHPDLLILNAWHHAPVPVIPIPEIEAFVDLFVLPVCVYGPSIPVIFVAGAELVPVEKESIVGPGIIRHRLAQELLRFPSGCADLRRNRARDIVVRKIEKTGKDIHKSQFAGYGARESVVAEIEPVL